MGRVRAYERGLLGEAWAGSRDVYEAVSDGVGVQVVSELLLSQLLGGGEVFESSFGRWNII